MDQKADAENKPADADTVSGDLVSDARPDTTCSCCGITRQGLPLTWTCSVENGTREYFCDDCARTHLRSIEGRLDSTWW